jgi:glycerophosphoryl diester phosphodiesterase
MIWGHRGAAADAPENTLPAFSLALGQGADGIELDVQMTRDGEVVVIHDETLERTTNGHGRVGGHTLAQLRELDASAGRPGFSGVRIPLLAEVLELVVGHDATVNIELKNNEVAYRGLEERVIDVVTKAGVEDQVIYSSFNHCSLMRMQSYGVRPLGALLSDSLYKPWRYVQSLGVQAIHPPHAMVDKKFVKACHDRHLAVNVWTVDHPKDIRRMLARGVDAIITNTPAIALDIRDAG